MKRLLFIALCLFGFIVSDSFVTQDIAEDKVPPITSPNSLHKEEL